MANAVRNLTKRNPVLQGCWRVLRPLLPPRRRGLWRGYLRFWKHYLDYGRLQAAAPCKLADLNPQLGDWQATTPISYYFYQDTWAFHKIVNARPAWHVDIGSSALLVGCLAGVVRTVSLDVRPLTARLPGLSPVCALITRLPFAGNSVVSLSSLCVLEHIGLGRYGDPLDPDGTKRAAAELARVLAPRGSLYVSVPCGRSYTAFNAHRSFEKNAFVALFPGLRLIDFVLVNDAGVTDRIDPNPASGLHVGLFHFSR